MFSVGTSVSGSFAYDSATPNATPSGPTGVYYGAMNSASLAVGSSTYLGNSAPSSSDYLQVATNYFSQDYFQFWRNVAGPAPSGLAVQQLYLRLSDNSMTAFSNTAIPTSLSLPSFDQTYFALSFSPGSVYLTGTITSIAQAVPEPAAALLFASGFVVLVIAAKRRATV
jgi:hypothetical protein